VDVIFIALPLQDHKGCIFYKKYVVARKCLRNGCVNPECRLKIELHIRGRELKS
jgi:hypothetical protein